MNLYSEQAQKEKKPIQWSPSESINLIFLPFEPSNKNYIPSNAFTYGIQSIKFHQNLSFGLGGVALSRNKDRQTD